MHDACLWEQLADEIDQNQERGAYSEWNAADVMKGFVTAEFRRRREQRHSRYQ